MYQKRAIQFKICSLVSIEPLYNAMVASGSEEERPLPFHHRSAQPSELNALWLSQMFMKSHGLPGA